MLQFGTKSPQSKFNYHHDTIVTNLKHFDLHGAQVHALMGLHEHFANINSPNIALAVLPTGAGKSGVAVLAPYVLNSSRVLIITPSVLISTQLYSDMCGPPANTFYVRRGLCSVENLYKLSENGLLVDKTLIKGSTTMEEVVHRFKQHNLVIANAHKFGENTGFDLAKFPADIFDTVIVDEAHHYPAKTWKQIIDHFATCKKVFLTATPTHNGKQIVGNDLIDQNMNYTAFNLSREDAVRVRIIRPLQFIEVGNHHDDEEQRIRIVFDGMSRKLQEHDEQDPSFSHKAMIICYMVEEVDRVVEVINRCSNAELPLAVAYHGKSGKAGFELFCNATSGNGRPARPQFLVSCGKALEGFDHPDISVVGILRNIAPTSSVLFSQFVGRCVRIKGPDDKVTATVVSHVFHRQYDNYKKLDMLAEHDPEDEAIVDLD